MSSAVDSVPGSYIDAQLKDAFANRFVVSKIAGLYLTKPLNDPRLSFLVAQLLKPFVEWALTPVLLVNDQLKHGMSVA